MKTIKGSVYSLVIIVSFIVCSTAGAQPAPNASTNAPTGPRPFSPSIVSTTHTPRSRHDSATEIVQQFGLSTNGPVLHTNHVVTVASGLNRWDRDAGKLVASDPRVTVHPGGVLASGAGFRVIFD